MNQQKNAPVQKWVGWRAVIVYTPYSAFDVQCFDQSRTVTHCHNSVFFLQGIGVNGWDAKNTPSLKKHHQVGVSYSDI